MFDMFWPNPEPTVPAPAPTYVDHAGYSSNDALPVPTSLPRAFGAETGLPLRGVNALVLIDDDGNSAVETIRAFGGQTVSHVGDATHVIVANSVTSSDLLRIPALAACAQSHIPIVRVSWLSEVIGSATNTPWDPDLIKSHVPLGTSSQVPPSRLPAQAPLTGSLSRPGNSLARTDQIPLTGSLAETWEFLKREHPEEVEAGQMRLAIELSLRECAITLHQAKAHAPGQVLSPEEILQVPKGASPDEVKAAYRKKALANHPDKGGDAGEFSRLQQAYLALMGKAKATDYELSGGPQLALPATGGAKDFELKEHRTLVASWFERHGADLVQHVAQQGNALAAMRLEVCDCGATNRNERGQVMYNQCFYLSLARSFLRGRRHERSELEKTALHFKRVVEAAVLSAHPDWGGERVGEDVQAFSDFLFFVLDSNALLSDLAVAIFDSVSGGVEIYKGEQYPSKAGSDMAQRENLLVLKYVPGHYQALVPSGSNHAGPTLTEMQRCLDERGVLYVVTNS